MSASPRLAVVDYGAGNLVSIDQALTRVGATVTIARDAEALRGADALIVPGVGAAGPAMARLDAHGLSGPIRAWLADGRPYLGVCLGLQLLFEGSDEDGAATLAVVPGRTVRLDRAPTLPHIGWNQVDRARGRTRCSTASTTARTSTSSIRTPAIRAATPTSSSSRRPTTARRSCRRSRATPWSASSSTRNGAAPTGCACWPTSSISSGPPDAPPAGHPVS